MILVTGANGQIGVDLLQALADRHGGKQIVATDLDGSDAHSPSDVTFEPLDVRSSDSLNELLSTNEIDTIYHLAGILSANGEQNPDLCWDVNIGGLRNVLRAAIQRSLKVFWPSSIAVFGPRTVRDEAPQTARTDPDTIYGITKATGERLCQYYSGHHALDVRSIRFPGVISYSAPPGGGTTDFAVEMFFGAIREGAYDCFVQEDTRLPMMYMPDAIKSVLDLMSADSDDLSVRMSYNVTAFSFSAGELAESIRKYIPGFTCDFKPDFRQEIADTWPGSIDDSVARSDWNWVPEFDLDAMVRDMLAHIGSSLGVPMEFPDSD
ncbi:MAG: NAD-dependent epimerase/dehydratase family protein [Rhodothermia bacterium]|nr:MAG: NAD-dependent epimerase/dehydratase family protein [Rhodothermia bacterium]